MFWIVHCITLGASLSDENAKHMSCDILFLFGVFFLVIALCYTLNEKQSSCAEAIGASLISLSLELKLDD